MRVFDTSINYLRLCKLEYFCRNISNVKLLLKHFHIVEKQVNAKEVGVFSLSVEINK